MFFDLRELLCNDISLKTSVVLLCFEIPNLMLSFVYVELWKSSSVEQVPNVLEEYLILNTS